MFLTLWGCVSTYFFIKTLFAADAKLRIKNMEVKKFEKYYFLCCSWIDLKRNGKDISAYLQQENINSIAVYGMGDMGIRLCKELQNSPVKIKYIIDQDISADTTFAPHKKLSEKLPKVDAIVVTPINSFSKIRDCLSGITTDKIISIEEIIYNA